MLLSRLRETNIVHTIIYADFEDVASSFDPGLNQVKR